MPNQPVVSVVVCTCNRVDRLRRCIDAFYRVNTSRHSELIIVDNASTDETSNFIAALPERIGKFHLRTALETKRGLSAAQNTGWRLASGKIIAFTDDDCYVREDFIDSLVEAFEEDTGVGFIGGRILLHDPQDLPVTILTSEDRRFFPPYRFIGAGQVMGANLAFTREALQRIGGMNELLGSGTRFGSNDVEGAASVLWTGLAGAYDPRPTVYHDHGRRTDEAINDLMLQYDEGRGAYYAEFLLRRESRWSYAKKLAQLWWPDFRFLIGALRRGRIPKLTRLVREVQGGAAYIAIRRRKSPRARHPI